LTVIKKAVRRPQNRGKSFSGRGFTPDPAGGAYSTPPDSPAGGGELAAPFPRTPTPRSALRPSNGKSLPSPYSFVFIVVVDHIAYTRRSYNCHYSQHSMPSRVYASVGPPSVRLSARPSLPTNIAAVARPAGDIDRLVRGARRRGGRMRAVPRCQST